MNPYAALLINAALCAVVTIMLFMSRLIGPHKRTTVKQQIFETGNPPIGSLRGFRFPVKFYLTAILFIVFDIEVVFMYPWAVVYRRARLDRARGDGRLHRGARSRSRLHLAGGSARVGVSEDSHRALVRAGHLRKQLRKPQRWTC